MGFGMMRCAKVLIVAAMFAAGPGLAMAQTATKPKTTKPGVVTGQQNSKPIPTQNQPQMETDMANQPPQARVLPPSTGAQAQPNPQPVLNK